MHWPPYRVGTALSRGAGLRAGLCAVLLAATGSWTPAATLRLAGDRLWLAAQDQPLDEVLAQFVQAGVRVRIDPTIEAQVRVAAENEDVEYVLSRMLAPFGYVLIWEQLDGPLGPLERLAEIQVFRTGQRQRMRGLQGEPRFRVLPMPDGSGAEYVADELVIGFSSVEDQEAIRKLIHELGGTVVESIPALGIYRIRLPAGTNVPALVARLADHPLVGAVEPNFAYRTPAPVPVASASRTTGPATAGPTARPVPGAAPVAVLDSGLRARPELEGLVAGHYNALNPGAELDDTAGHGTQMALIASGAVSPDGGPGAGAVQVLGIRTFDDQGITSNFAVMRSIFHAVDAGARVLNMSWGSPANSGFLSQAVTAADRAGMLLVAAVGNEPTNQPVFPAGHPTVMGVGAALPDGSPWAQSNYGDFVHLAAPGTATLPVGHQGEPGSYAGTSIASAYVAHALGLYFAHYPEATADEARTALRRALTKGAAGGRDPYRGFGLLDRDAVLRLLD